jgi:hypothetical protein
LHTIKRIFDANAYLAVRAVADVIAEISPAFISSLASREKSTECPTGRKIHVNRKHETQDLKGEFYEYRTLGSIS